MERRGSGAKEYAGRLVPKGRQDSAQGFNQVLTLGPHTKKANRPERAAGLELPDSLSRQSLGSGAVPCLSSTSRKGVNPFRKRF